MSYRQSESAKGLAALVCAYTLWASAVVLFKQFAGRVPALDVTAHRAVWSFVFMLPLILLAGRGRETLRILAQPRLLGGLTCTALLIFANWLVFVWSIDTGQVLQSSLGYYINPLFSVWLGVVILGEVLRPAQLAAAALAAVSVCAMLFLLGVVPWISISLAFSFALYGLLRKLLAVDHLQGLFVETLVLTPVALAWLGWRMTHDSTAGIPSMFELGIGEWLLLALSGPATALPLLLFVYGVKRRSLTVVGFTQYINPTLQFLIAVVVYGEVFGSLHLAIFAGIWTALGIFLVDLYRHEKKRARAAAAA